MNPEELKWVIDEINAKKVIPVHTDDAEGFNKMSKKVVMAEKGKEMRV